MRPSVDLKTERREVKAALDVGNAAGVEDRANIRRRCHKKWTSNTNLPVVHERQDIPDGSVPQRFQGIRSRLSFDHPDLELIRAQDTHVRPTTVFHVRVGQRHESSLALWRQAIDDGLNRAFPSMKFQCLLLCFRVMPSDVEALGEKDSHGGHDERTLCPDQVAGMHVASGKDTATLSRCLSNLVFGRFRGIDRLREARVVENLSPRRLR